MDMKDDEGDKVENNLTKASFKTSACAALSLARNVLELLGVVLLSAYVAIAYETDANFTKT